MTIFPKSDSVLNACEQTSHGSNANTTLLSREAALVRVDHLIRNLVCL